MSGPERELFHTDLMSLIVRTESSAGLTVFVVGSSSDMVRLLGLLR